MAQLETAKVLAYVREMGVDPALINEMVKTGREQDEGPDKHQRYSRMLSDRMAELNVITSSAVRPRINLWSPTGNWAVRGEWVRPGVSEDDRIRLSGGNDRSADSSKGAGNSPRSSKKSQ